MRKSALMVMTIIAMACSSTKQSKKESSVPAGDGSSYENAIFIKKNNEKAGVDAEYVWIREHYPGSRTKMQALQVSNGKHYDVLTIVTGDGTEKQVYFDISNFFGKW